MRNPKRTKRKQVVIDGIAYDATMVEVLEEFVERRPLENIGVEGMYIPPWNECFPGEHGTESWVEYGPDTLSAFDARVKKHRDQYGAVDSGGLWDASESVSHDCINPATGEVLSDMRAKGDPRYDHDLVAEYVSRHSSEMSLQMVSVFVCFWRDCLSPGRIATKLSMPVKTVENYVLRLRKRAREWSE